MTCQPHDDDHRPQPAPECDPDDEPAPVRSDQARPTPKQLAYLRALANRTGQTFAYPRTTQQASREIRRLKNAQPSPRIERAIERKHIADAIAAGPQDASRIREDEIEGYGSNCRWSH
jgi:hypothetical protein